ncbi:ArsR/SmtB family transcription factor [Catelliglobosispora koreensis]|uniref:ArsR/SmtB family transcription factor n=1 Tax=Catelliglobosispora koreensis TaxID=129052 RepID=UPI00038105FB|nr:metalloregulator ArsR/SmtB family transcription factor [Catelliglobosispora koreensis]
MQTVTAQLSLTAHPGRVMLPAEGDAVAVVAKFFRALGDPARLRLLGFLLHDEHTVTECVQHIGLAQSRVSTHLACLADCGYIQARRVGKHTFYRVAEPRVAQLVALAHILAADNREALCACHRIPPAAAS